MEIGIIGLPNVGKTTLFNVLTSAHAEVGNFPFTTKEQNVGITILPDKRLSKLKEVYQPQKLTPATIKFVDIAGLVKGASQGLGLGNKFLAYIREVDALIQVLRCFPDEKTVNVLSEINPGEEIEIVQTELLLADLEQVQRIIEKFEPKAKAGDKEAKEKISLFNEIKKNLEQGISLKSTSLPREEIFSYHFLTAKPIIYLANLAEEDLPRTFAQDTQEESKKTLPAEPTNSRAKVRGLSSYFYWTKLKEHVWQKEKSEPLPLCVKLEEEISQLPSEEREKFRLELGEKSEYLENLIWSAYHLLNLVTFFTVVGTEVRAWTVSRGTPAVKAAGKVHSDMERGFIKAEIFNFNALEKVALPPSAHGVEKTLHEKGLVHIEGKEYQIQDGDIVHFRFHV